MPCSVRCWQTPPALQGRKESMQKRFVKIKELAKYIGITEGTLYVWVCHKRIPYYKFGKALRFDLAEIDAWASKKKVKPLCL